MKKGIRWTLFVLFCLTLSNCITSMVFAGASLRTVPINYYNPTTQTTTPFFAYGWYSAYGTWLNDTYLSECGGNTVIACCTCGDDPNSLILVLDRAATHGKKVIVDLGGDFMYGANSTTNITRMVNALKNHPALLCWFLGDENEWHPSPTAAEVVTSAALIHTLDTHRQIIQVFSGFGYFDRNKIYNTDGVDPFSNCLQYDYLPSTDVYSIDSYPNHNPDNPNYPEHATDAPDSFLDMQSYLPYLMGQKAVDESNACFFITQGFGNCDVDNPFGIGDQYGGQWRLPSYREYRWNIFSAIAAGGARGMANWIYSPGLYSDQNVFYDWLESIVKPVFDEQAMIAHGMETGYGIGTVDVNWTDKVSDGNPANWSYVYGGTNHAYKYDRITQLPVYDDIQGKYFFIVTNNGGSATENVQLTISNLPVPLANLNVLIYDSANSYETFTLTDLGSGSYRLSDTIAPFEVMIYSVDATRMRGFIGDTGRSWDTTSKVTSACSSNGVGRGSVYATDGSGVDTYGWKHACDTPWYKMWISLGSADANHPWTSPSTHWIRYQFNQSYPIGEMRIWNYNETAYLGTGMKHVRVLASNTDDQAGWTAANANPVFEGVIPQADGTSSSPCNLIVNFGGRFAKYVLIASVVGNEHNWSSGAISEDGLSEVRFYPPSSLVAPTGFIGDTGSDWDTSSKVTVYAGSNSQGRNPSYAIDGTGISSNGLTHDGTVWYGMYLSTATDSPYPYIRDNTQWLRYDLDQIYELGQMQIWNYNESNQWWDGPSCGMKRVRIIASTTDTQAGWLDADATPIFDGNIPEATGTPFDPVNLIVDFAGIDARYILMYVPEEAGTDKNWSDGAVAEVGLSEARFYTTPRGFIGDTGSGWDTSSLVGSSADSQEYYRESVQTVNGTGISGGGSTHDNVSPFNEMWLSDGTARRYAAYVNDGTHWIKYDMDAIYNLDKMQIWNYNESNQWWDGPSCGMKQVRILASTTDDQTGWTAANSNPVFEGVIPKATGTDLNPVNLEVNFAGRQVRYILITSDVGNEHNWSSGAITNDGLSEVRFYAQKQAFSPSPGNETISVSITRDISWSAGYGATSHDVYLGASQTDVATASRSNQLSVLVSPNQGGTTYDTGTLSANTTYYWRIDECISGNVTTKGSVWKFTTAAAPPGQATAPSPTNGAANVAITDTTLSWTAGSGTVTGHDVYFGTVNPPVTKVSSNQPGTTYNPGTLVNNTTYYWRINEIGPGGTTTGTVWSFTTVKAAPIFQAAGTAQSGTGNITVGWPTHQTGDVALLFIESCGGQVASLGTPAGFAAVTNSPQSTGTGTNGTRLTAYWCRATSSSMSSPIVTDPGDHVYGRILTFRGVTTTGNPWDATAGGVKATASTTTTFGTVTTTAGNELIVLVASRDNDSAAAAWSSWANANLSSLTERSDGGTTSGNGGGIGVATGVKVVAGVIGSSTATVTSSVDGHMTIAIKP